MAKKRTPSKPRPASNRTAPRGSAKARSKSRTKSVARPQPNPAAKSVKLLTYHVDAFTTRPFHGNPAAVVLLDGKWLPDDLMQAIAAEHNLPITAFVFPKGGKFQIRWFSPTTEIDLCGHGTLAAAHVLFNHAKVKGNRLVFSTPSGDMPATRTADLITLDFPARPGRKITVTNALCAALGAEPVEAYMARDLMAVFGNKREVHELQPDMDGLAALDAFGVIATAPGAGHDFVSRFFSPRHGVDEDHVTGSSHCTLVPYWAYQLGKNHLTAHQVSHRSGELFCELQGKRVLIGGHAVTVGQGTLSV